MLKTSKYSFLLVVLCSLLLSSCLKNDNTPAVSAAQQLVDDVATIDAYLTKNGISAYTDVNGLRYTVSKVGTGFSPRLDNTLKVVYTGTILSSGTVFADKVTSDTTLTLANYIQGWQIGLRLLPEGSTATLYIPSGYAYGTQGNGPIPGNAILVFNVKIVKVYTTDTEKQQLKSDVTSIDQFLQSKSITAVKDTTGLRYVITQQGNGVIPNWYSQVTMNVVGKTLVTGTVFYNATLAPSASADSRVVNYIRCFQTALQKLPSGSKATLYVPSGLAFGVGGSADGLVPSNSNLIYDVELTNVTN